MSSISSLYIGVSGLNVSQNALNTTAHNLANVDTKGYVRQQVIMQDFNYLTIGENAYSKLQKGLGAEIATVKQVRDFFLDQAYRREIGRQSFYEAQYEAVDEVEGLFGELEGVAFQNSLSDFWVSLQELAKEPESIVTRASLIQTSVTFIERATNISKQLNEYQLNLNTKILNEVDRINDIGTEIKDLNYKISLYEANGLEKANDLRDKRNVLLDELGQMVNITYRELPNTQVAVNVEGVPFVTEDVVTKMEVKQISESSPMLKPIWPSLGDVDVFNFDRVPAAVDNTDIGSLKGLLLSRGNKQGNYTDIPIRDQFETDKAYEEAVKKYNIEIEPSVIMTVQAQFDQLIHGVVTTVNDILAPNKTVTQVLPPPDNGTKEIKILDEDKAAVGMDGITSGEALFNRISTDRYTEKDIINILDEHGNTVTVKARVYNEEDPKDNYSLYTVGEIEVNKKLLDDSNLIPLSSNKGTGDYDVDTVNALVSKWQESFATLSPNLLTKNNFNEYYTSMVAAMANRGQQLNALSVNQESMVASIETQRQAVAGVSSDDELTNLIKYQHAYNASARYINVVSEMLEHIVTSL